MPTATKTRRTEAAAILAEWNVQSPRLAQADLDRRADVDTARLALADAQAALVTAQTLHHEAAVELPKTLAAIAAPGAAAGVLSLHNICESIRERIRIAPSPELAALLERIEGQLLDALDTATTVDVATLHRELGAI
jgi:hypothetical protein